MRKILAIMVIAALCAAGAVLAEAGLETSANDFLGEWEDLNGIRHMSILEDEEGNGYVVNVQMDMFDGEKYGYYAWAYGCVYDEETHALKSFARVTSTGEAEPDGKQAVMDIDFFYTDAEFFFDETGMLHWNDEDEGLDDGMLFQRAITENGAGEAPVIALVPEEETGGMN